MVVVDLAARGVPDFYLEKNVASREPIVMNDPDKGFNLFIFLGRGDFFLPNPIDSNGVTPGIDLSGTCKQVVGNFAKELPIPSDVPYEGIRGSPGVRSE